MLLEEKIKIYRKKKGLSQVELAKELGITSVHLSRLENGKYKPSLSVLQKLSQCLGIDINSLLDQKQIKIEDIKDTSLLDRLKLIESLDKKDRDVIIHIIDAFFARKNLQKSNK